jgi:hypothetical protein
LNEGAFAVVQLFPLQSVGDLDDPLTMSELWEVGWGVDETNTMVRKRIDRGPVFSKHGVPRRRDWDPIFRVPVWIMTLDGTWRAYDDQPLVNSDVSNGRLIETVRKLLSVRINKRIDDSKKQAAANLNRQVDEMTTEMADFLWHEALKPNATRPVVHKEAIKEDPGYARWQQQQQIDLGKRVYGL